MVNVNRCQCTETTAYLVSTRLMLIFICKFVKTIYWSPAVSMYCRSVLRPYSTGTSRLPPPFFYVSSFRKFSDFYFFSKKTPVIYNER